MSLLSPGLRFEEVRDTEVWHSDVEVFSVFDLTSNELLGYFYLDIYQRFSIALICYVLNYISFYWFSQTSYR